MGTKSRCFILRSSDALRLRTVLDTLAVYSYTVRSDTLSAAMDVIHCGTAVGFQATCSTKQGPDFF